MVDLSDIPGTNCYCDDSACREIRKRIDSFSQEVHTLQFNSLPQAPFVRFIDSGNYHYMSLFFMRKISVPFSLLLLDNHPDTKPPVFAGLTSCGGWAREARETVPNLGRIFMAGVDSKLIEEESPLPEDTFYIPFTDLSETLKKIETPLYISLDKDLMSEDFARTDWSQGSYTLDQIVSVLKTALCLNNVVGIDICGEKKENPTDEDLMINEKTNQSLLDAILS
ncbi:MAG: arginase [Lachnospiraceae bacterium]|nr:MAG: arginase [Lachnospiraceae bacterium]